MAPLKLDSDSTTSAEREKQRRHVKGRHMVFSLFFRFFDAHTFDEACSRCFALDQERVLLPATPDPTFFFFLLFFSRKVSR